ncbi:hypothetical protein [Rubrivirga sp. IMCC45206]|uniref:hypothetical protein n=1 Tax=Rubrivirga sp. IMCC45206 TaxID=3391614 RepID=UPI00398FA492
MRTPLLLALVLLTGCTTSRVVDLSATSTRAEVNGRAERGYPVVHLVGERGRQVRSLHVAPDVTTWVDKKTGESRSAPTADVEAIAFRRDGLGALQGTGIGVAVGGFLGAWMGTLDGNGTLTYTPLFGAVLGAVAGVEIGAIAGAIRSDRFVYEADRCPGVPLACAAGP